LGPANEEISLFKQNQREHSIKGAKPMADESPKAVNPQSPHTLKDEEIVTERKFSRRSFMLGTVIAGGAAALLAGSAALAQEQDPDKKKDAGSQSGKEQDPDKKKETGSKSGKEADPDKKKDKNKKDKGKDKGKEGTADPDKPK
jgi:hypothetical protein